MISMIQNDGELTASECHEVRRLNTSASEVLQDKMLKRERGIEKQTGLLSCLSVNGGAGIIDDRSAVSFTDDYEFRVRPPA